MISGDVKPFIGDTFLIATDHLPEDLSIGPTGQAINWDYTRLQSAYAKRVIVNGIQKTGGENNISANAMITSYFDGDHLLDIEEGRIYEVGRRIPNPFIKGEYLEGFVENKIPWFQSFRFGETGEASTTIIFPIDAEMLRLKRNLSWLESNAVLRIVYTIDITWKADAWGRIRIPFGTYDVVRQQVFEDITGAFEVKNASGQWTNIDAAITGVNLPDDRYERYLYWSDELEHPVVILEIDPTTSEITKVHYKAFEFSSKVVNNQPSNIDVLAYPNPAFDLVRFDLMNLSNDIYTIEIYDILGRQINSFQAEVDGYTTVALNLSHLKKGTYIYRVANSRNNSVISKRIVMIKP